MKRKERGRKYCTVTDLSPFGIKVETLHRTWWGAKWSASNSLRRLPMKLAEARKLDREIYAALCKPPEWNHRS